MLSKSANCVRISLSYPHPPSAKYTASTLLCFRGWWCKKKDLSRTSRLFSTGSRFCPQLAVCAEVLCVFVVCIDVDAWHDVLTFRSCIVLPRQWGYSESRLEFTSAAGTSDTYTLAELMACNSTDTTSVERYLDPGVCSTLHRNLHVCVPSILHHLAAKCNAC